MDWELNHTYDLVDSQGNTVDGSVVLQYATAIEYVGYLNIRGIIISAQITFAGQIRGYDDLHVKSTGLPLSKGYTKTCDCGGYKTYMSWASEVHSRWCKVNL